MPLIKGAKAKTKKGIASNIKKEINSGKEKNQAIAIAFSVAKKTRSNKKNSK